MNRYSDSPTGDWLMGPVTRNPEALLLLAAGCALLMRKGGSMSRSGAAPVRSRGNDRGYSNASDMSNVSNMSSMSDMSSLSEARQGLSRTAGRAADYASDMTERVSDTAGKYVDSVSQFAADSGRSIAEGSARLTRQAQATMQTTMTRVLREQPLAVAALGLATGAVVAAILPSSEMENRALGGAHDALTDAVEQFGDTAMAAAGKVGGRLKAAAEERGLTPDGLKEVASEMAGTFTEAFSGKDEHQGASIVPDKAPAAPAHLGTSEGGGSSRDSGMGYPNVRPTGGSNR